MSNSNIKVNINADMAKAVEQIKRVARVMSRLGLIPPPAKRVEPHGFRPNYDLECTVCVKGMWEH